MKSIYVNRNKLLAVIMIFASSIILLLLYIFFYYFYSYDIEQLRTTMDANSTCGNSGFSISSSNYSYDILYFTANNSPNENNYSELYIATRHKMFGIIDLGRFKLYSKTPVFAENDKISKTQIKIDNNFNVTVYFGTGAKKATCKMNNNFTDTIFLDPEGFAFDSKNNSDESIKEICFFDSNENIVAQFNLSRDGSSRGNRGTVL